MASKLLKDAKEDAMNFAKKVAIAVEMDEEVTGLFDMVREMEFLKNSELNFVHVVHTVSYSFGLADSPLVYPIEADRLEIKRVVLDRLTRFSNEHLPKGFDGKVNIHCLFAEHQREEFSRFVKDQNIDLVIVATRLKHGFLESSFAQYVNKHTNANLLLLKKN